MLQSTIAKREVELTQVEGQIAKARLTLKDEHQKADREKVTFDELLDKHAPTLAKLDKEITAKQATRDSLIQESKKADADLRQARKHLKEVEQQISDTTEDGNLQLKSINYEIEYAETRKQQISRDTYDAHQRLDTLEDDYKQREAGFTEKLKSLATNLKNQEAALTTAEGQLRDAEASLETTNQQVDKKLAHLKEKEESLMTKRSALLREMEEINVARRRWQSSKSLYDDIE